MSDSDQFVIVESSSTPPIEHAIADDNRTESSANTMETSNPVRSNSTISLLESDGTLMSADNELAENLTLSDMKSGTFPIISNLMQLSDEIQMTQQLMNENGLTGESLLTESTLEMSDKNDQLEQSDDEPTTIMGSVEGDIKPPNQVLDNAEKCFQVGVKQEEEENTTLNNKVDELKRQELQEQIEAVQVSAKLDFCEMNKILSEKESLLMNYRTTIEQLQNQKIMVVKPYEHGASDVNGKNILEMEIMLKDCLDELTQLKKDLAAERSALKASQEQNRVDGEELRRRNKKIIGLEATLDLKQIDFNKERSGRTRFAVDFKVLNEKNVACMNDLAEKCKEISRMKNEFEVKEVSQKILNEKVDKLTTELNKFKSDYETERLVRVELESDLKSSLEQNQVDKECLEKQKEDNYSKQKEIESKDSSLAEKNRELQSYNDHLDTLTAQLKTNENELVVERLAHDNVVSENKENIKLLEESRLAFEKLQHESLGEINRMKQDIEMREESLKKIGVEQNMLKKENAIFKNKCKMCKCADLTNDKERILANYEKEKQLKQQLLDDINNVKSTNVDEINHLVAKLSETEKLLAKYRDDKKRLAKDNQKKDACLEEKKRQLETCNVDIESLRAELQSFKTEFETERSNRVQLVQEKDDIQTAHKLLQKCNQSLEGNIQTLNEQIEKLNAELATCKNDLGNSQSTHDALNIEYDRVKSELKMLQENNQKLIEEAQNRQMEQESKADSQSTKEFFDSTGDQFICIKKLASKNMKNSNVSAQLFHDGMEIVLHNKGSLMIVNNNLVAEVEIEQPNLLDSAENYQDAKTILYSQLRIERILPNENLTKLKNCRNDLLSGLDRILNQSTVEAESKIAYVQLSRIVKKMSKCNMPLNHLVCREIKETHCISEDLKKQVTSNEREERILNEILCMFKLRDQIEAEPEYLYLNLQKLLSKYAKRHSDSLKEVAPSHLHKMLCAVSEEKLPFITKADVKLYADITSVLNKDIFPKPLRNYALRCIEQVNYVQIDELDQNFRTMNATYFLLCKSMNEIITQINDKTGIEASELLKNDDFEWKARDNIHWKKENASNKYLERQYYFLFRLLNHYEARVNRKPLDYSIQILSNPEWNQWSELKTTVMDMKSCLEAQSDSSKQSEELLVWYYLLEDALVDVLSKSSNIKVTESILQSYIKLVRETKKDQLEILRMATHNTIQFITHVVPNITLAVDELPIDKCILQHQIDITCLKLSNTFTYRDYRDLINVFSSYWRLRSEVITAIVNKIPLPETDTLKQQLLNVFLLALEKYAEHKELLAFFRVFEKFLIDLKEVPFEWFINSISGVNMDLLIKFKMIEVVNDKWKDTNKRIYRVIDSKNFPSCVQNLGQSLVMPKHNMIECLRFLLISVTKQLQRENWTSNKRFSPSDQISSTCDLISTIHRSLLYLPEWTVCVSFQEFCNETVNPFNSLIKNSTSRQDFSARANRIKESLWFIRKQNQMDVEIVLQQYEGLNDSLDCKILKEAYLRYSKHYEGYTKISMGKDYTTAATLVTKKVKELVSDNMHFTTWDTQFKQKTVPQILAGLGSIWSSLVSEDVSSTGRYLSPNCVQIVCVLRLLSVDKPTKGIDKHLAQVLTGQGKSLILALVAALLALTGHQVNIGCYNSYLVDRDRDNFFTFYTMLGVDNIIYNTLGSLMKQFINVEVYGKTIEHGELLQDLLFQTKTEKWSNNKNTSTNSVLLVDEVDRFYEDFCSKTCNLELFPTISGIDKIQERIWEIVTAGGDLDIDQITAKICRLIQPSTQNAYSFNHLRTFLASTKSYKMLTDDCELKDYTHTSLFNEHLKRMIETAIDVFRSKDSKWSQFYLNELGQICMTSNEENATNTICGYTNIFCYFLLKKNNFISQVNGMKNYGYLNIKFGSLFCAMFPINAPLILGVSGTVEELTEFKTHSIMQLLKIEQLSLVPTFYGSSKLLFNETTDFSSCSMKELWRSHIFNKATQIVAENRAVLIFFYNDHELNAFKSEYGGQFDRLNELTENSEDKEKYINESGIAKTITCATREMGRGIDYKSSVVVEKNGGVHVIQTFFSMDVKEEIQIKGRTARQDNNGSYELIVCVKDLIQCGLVSKNANDITYCNLANKRKLLISLKNNSMLNAIENKKNKHNATINYIKSVSEYIELFTEFRKIVP